MLHRSGTSALLLARHAAGSPSLRLSLFSGDGQRTQPSGLSGMGLINREKRRTRQARKGGRGAAYFCVCGGPCPPLLFGALPVTLPQGRCLGSRGFGLGSPLDPGVPLALCLGVKRGWRFNSGALSRTFLQLCAFCALHASDRPLNGFLWS